MIATDAVDVDLAHISLRYGASMDAIVDAASRDPYWQSQGLSPSRDQVMERAANGNAVAVPVPAVEQRTRWGVYTNTTGSDVTLATAAAEINGRPTPAPQPQVTPGLLWSYVVNASLRATVVQNRAEAAIRDFDDHPSNVPVPAGAQVRFPMVPPGVTRAVCAAAGCSVALAPPPAWMPSFDHHLTEIERMGARILFVIDLFARVQQEAASQIAAVDFALEMMRRARRASERDTGLNDAHAAEVETKLSDLKARMAEHVPAPIHELRPGWERELERVARVLVELLSNSRFLEHWHLLLTDEQFFAQQSEERRLASFAQISQAIYALGMSDAQAAWAMFSASLSAVDAQSAEPDPPNNVVTFTVNRWSSLWTLANATSEGSAAYSLMATVLNMQILYTIRAPGMASSATLGSRISFWTELLRTPLEPDIRNTITHALTEGEHLGRPAAALAIFRRAVGPTASGVFGLTFALLGLAGTYWDGQTHTQVWDEIAHGLSLASGAGSVGTASVQTTQAIRAMFRTAAGEVPWGQGAANFAGRAAGVLMYVQGLYQVGTYTYFAITDPSRARGRDLLSGAVTMASGILAVAAVASAVPGLQVAAVLLAIGAVGKEAGPEQHTHTKNV
jgi:hypothetical protein